MTQGTLVYQERDHCVESPGDDVSAVATTNESLVVSPSGEEAAVGLGAKDESFVRIRGY